MSKESIYRISFFQQGQVYELFARQVAQGGLLGFVEVEDLLFGERSQLVVDPSEERLKTEFEGVKRFFVPLHAVLRIDQVDRQGTPRVMEREGGDGNVSPFPVPVYPPPSSEKS